MSDSARVSPVHPQAYRPRRNYLSSGGFSTLIFLVLLAGLTVNAVRAPTWGAFGPPVVLALMLGRSLFIRGNGGPPFAVDELGLRFRGTGSGDGERLVPWESVTAVVLFEIPRTDMAKRGWQPAIGARLAGHPDGVSVQRPLSGWSVDRGALSSAVARFGGDVPVEDGPRSEGRLAESYATEFRHLAESAQAQWDSSPSETSPGVPARPSYAVPAHQTPDTSAGGPGWAGPPTAPSSAAWLRPKHYRPVDPAAYLARMDVRSNIPLILIPSVFVVFGLGVVAPSDGKAGFGMAGFAGAFLLWVLRSMMGGGAVALAIDRPGVLFGASSSGADDQTHRLVPWSDITAVVVYEQLHSKGDDDKWMTAVGVRLRGAPDAVRHWRVVNGWRFDRPALEAAVSRFAPGVPVIDGPPQRDSARAYRPQYGD